MKILSITAQKPHSTGSGTYLTELVKAFDEARCEQAVVAGIYPDDQVSFPAGVNFFPVFFENKERPFSDEKILSEFIGFPVVGMSDSMPYPSTKYSEMTDEMIAEFEAAFIKVIGEAISEQKPDVIICHHLFLLTAMVREHFPNEKVYGICHGSDLRQIVNCPKLTERVVPLIRKLDHIFALHEEQKTKIEEIFNIENCKVSVIGSGYNQNLFNCEGRRGREAGDLVRVCFAGKVSYAKGAAELLDAVDKLNDEGMSDFELIICGGCQEDELKRRLNNLPDNVKYLGMLSQDELAKVYKTCDIFVLPSYYEGLGLVLIEAMASGLVPIVTDLPGIKDWIDANVINPNVRYIPMPEMASIDSPTVAGREVFICNLSNILSNAILSIKNNNLNKDSLPDTSLITWKKVSEKILNL